LLIALGTPGVLATAVLGTVAVVGMFVVSQRQKVAHHTVVEVEEAGEAVAFPRRKRRRVTPRGTA
ncbi:hypothetical protein M2C68_18915, partial [Pseudomonas sp. BAgro211]|nr:hypothetical protein [Pseudomonas sp. BAgro211]